MDFLEKGLGLRQALATWDFGGTVAGALRFGKGHINDTFAVYVQQPGGGMRRYILQRVNTHVFADPAGLMENILAVTGYLRRAIAARGGDADRETLTVVPTRTGTPWHTGEDGAVWRVYYFIEDAVCYQVAATPALYRAAARAYGGFARLLEGFPAHTLKETIPRFHDTPWRYRNLLAAAEADPMGRAKDCRAELEFAMARAETCGLLTGLLAEGRLPLRVTHNDAKLNNVLMNPAALQGVCVIDLDTVMPGLWLNDYGDAIRSGAHGATEDEKDLGQVAFSLPMFEAYTGEYLATAGPVMTALEKQMMPWAARLITFECGMRFLTDHLEGDQYFRIARPGHNLDRCRTQFKLVAGMEDGFAQMEEIAQRLAAAPQAVL